ncbi:magnesium transporter MgtE N-terminal domain-containing protein [Corynebacterium doosanense]|uniref:Magnesium transporter n=1 Tax=Corynebacterium doosanense CAU 212 = DSM 45436 TaxID=558173 RepID=A0A097IF92_9CORY|nr:CBS domain-containing protein [Corynebacterium doosanense]AIT60798.1 magnesium transporter [Corynebacterium doosanense CAU 212 = DSM 45436]
MSGVTRVYAGRLVGLQVRGPDFEIIGRVRDVVINVRPGATSRAMGLVIELVNKRRIFVPMLRISEIEPGDVTLNTGSVSMRAFSPRSAELTVMGDLVGSKVSTDDPDHADLHGVGLEIADLELERTRTRDWVITKVAVFTGRTRFGRSPKLRTLPWLSIDGVAGSVVESNSSVSDTVATYEDMRPADAATSFQELSSARRSQVARELSDELLADILAELPDDHQAHLLETLDIERAADVLEEMDPDDAADVLQELSNAKAEVLLGLMDPEESAPVRRMMSFADDTVGALMTPEPLVLTPQTTVAEALALARDPELPTSLASLIFVVRPPTATPTGPYLGCVHLQKLLREPPSELIGGLLDDDLPILYATDSEETAARYFATYNLVCGPVLDDDGHLLGAVAVDDLIDHLLPEDWRETGLRPETRATSSASGLNPTPEVNNG